MLHAGRFQAVPATAAAKHHHELSQALAHTCRMDARHTPNHQTNATLSNCVHICCRCFPWRVLILILMRLTCHALLAATGGAWDDVSTPPWETTG